MTREADLEALLAALDTADEVSEEKDPAKENSAIKHLRDHAKRLERDLKKAQEERDTLAQFREETEARQKMQALIDAGLSPRQSEVFLKAFDVVGAENIDLFKREVLGMSGEGATQSQEFAPTGSAGERSQKKLTKEEFEALWRSDPVKAQEVAARDGVAWERKNPPLFSDEANAPLF